MDYGRGHKTGEGRASVVVHDVARIATDEGGGGGFHAPHRTAELREF